jgi:hypothetical protein
MAHGSPKREAAGAGFLSQNTAHSSRTNGTTPAIENTMLAH